MTLTTITFLRHSKTTANENDRKRVLSEEGVSLAQERRGKLGNPTFDLVIHSDRFRTEQTARIIAGISDDVPTITIPQLMPQETDPWNAAVSATWGKLGNTSLHQYLVEAWEAMVVASTIGEAAVLYHMGVQPTMPNNILIVGHAIFTPAICYFMIDMGVSETILGTPVEECQGFELIIDDDGFTSFSRFIE